MYGSCQRSGGITSRYASAAALTIARISSRSSSRQGRIAMPRRLAAQSVRGWRAALAEVPPRRLVRHTPPRLVAEVVRRDLTLHRRQLERVPIGTEVEYDDLAGLV